MYYVNVSTFQKCHGGAQPLQIYGRATTQSYSHPITTSRLENVK